MRFHFLLASLAMSPLGCCQPMTLLTRSHLLLDSPVKAQVTVNSTPASGGPIVSMAVDGGPECVEGPVVAFVDVDGLLLNQNQVGPYSAGENQVAVFKEKLDTIACDASVCAVVLRINSPGGGVTATDLMWHELKSFRARTGLPVVACILDLGTGGSYYLATAADKIFATPTSIIGGIGVIWNSYNLRDLMALYNVVPQPIKAGPNIDMGSTAQALSPEARKVLQATADVFHQRFISIIRQARPDVDAMEMTIVDGRIFTADEALKHRLIDEIGYPADAVSAAAGLAKQNQFRVVLFHRQSDLAASPYAITPNRPIHPDLFPISVPGFERSRFPMFLYLWQPEPALQRLGG